MRALKKFVPYLIIGIVAIPFLVMYAAFFLQSVSEKVTLGFIPQRFSLDNFNFLWKSIQWGLEKTSIWKVLLNTVVFSITSGGIVTLVCLFAGYALSRIEFRGKNFLLSLQFMLHAFPGPIILIAVFLFLLYLGLLYRIPGVALARASLEIPLGIWMIKGFFDAVPLDIERASVVDGCNRIQTWYLVFIPLIKPGIAAVFIWGFLFAWHDFIYVYTLLPGRIRLMSTLIQGLIATEVMDYGLLAAISLFYMLPPMLLFIFLQKALLKVPVLGGKGGA